MQRVKVLGIVGNPRQNGNTAKLVKRVTPPASACIPGGETKLNDGGKEFNCTI
jgi:multimeric flavodoxin WrbA